MTRGVKDNHSALRNPTPFSRRPLSHHAQAILSRIVPADRVDVVIDRPYVVKGWLDQGAVSVVYGEPNVGKSFWAIDIAHHVQEGLPWAGHRVRKGNVLYVAAEGGAMFDNRLVARKARFHVLQGAITLTGRSSDGPGLVEAVHALSETVGEFSLIVIDTMARVMGDADENAAADIGQLVKNVDRIKEATGAHVMIVHHTGKDTARGARGHSSLRAAVDTEIQLTAKDDDLMPYDKRAKTTKQRDMPGGLEVDFRLQREVLGTDSDGDQVTSCTVVHETEGGPA
ncbi:helicase RepA family protein [Pontibaca methylaminivorans]|uniref:helicase RepA family protein n=1 Tax=Pontibaca methylaminivorans TaxID=515897 RepID=UPI0009FBDA0C|nr:helicase RepA family protein [Pontibaca methylaminivorans]